MFVLVVNSSHLRQPSPATSKKSSGGELRTGTLSLLLSAQQTHTNINTCTRAQINTNTACRSFAGSLCVCSSSSRVKYTHSSEETTPYQHRDTSQRGTLMFLCLAEKKNKQIKALFKSYFYLSIGGSARDVKSQHRSQNKTKGGGNYLERAGDAM